MNFNNIGFSLPSLIFIIIILSIYILKNRKRGLREYLFIALMIIVAVIGLLEIIIPFAITISKTNAFTNIVSKLFLSLVAIWQFMFVIYIDTLVYNGDRKQNKLVRYPILIIATILMLFFIVSFIFMDMEYSGGKHVTNYAITGMPTFYMYLDIVLASIFVLYYINIHIDFIKNIYMKPIIIVLTLYFLIIIAQVAFNIELNEITFFGSLLITVIYFTIESQDFKLIDEYKESKIEAEKEDKAKTAFLVNMSHEIRTPLNTIIGFAQIINEEPTFDREYFQKDLKNIIDASETLSSLIHNILDISVIESDELTLNEKEYILESLIFEINSLIPSKITNDELRFTIDIDQNIPREYYGDAYKIFKVLSYILLNAIDNTTYGEVKLEISGEKKENGYFEQKFVIYNTGHTMSNENFEKDFEDFVKLQSTGEGKLSNIKLGLIIAKELITLLNGDIEFINAKGQGTRYIIKIKQKIVSELPIGNIFENVTNGLATTRNLLYLPDKTAMVVDDGEVNLAMARKSLEQYGLKIITVKSGKECVEIVKNQKIDIIFLDHMMPEMDGIATIKALNSTGCEIPPIVALTANNYDALKTEYIAQGFNYYLQKPIVFKELNRVMKEIFAQNEDD